MGEEPVHQAIAKPAAVIPAQAQEPIQPAIAKPAAVVAQPEPQREADQARVAEEVRVRAQQEAKTRS